MEGPQPRVLGFARLTLARLGFKRWSEAMGFLQTLPKNVQKYEPVLRFIDD